MSGKSTSLIMATTSILKYGIWKDGNFSSDVDKSIYVYCIPFTLHLLHLRPTHSTLSLMTSPCHKNTIVCRELKATGNWQLVEYRQIWCVYTGKFKKRVREMSSQLCAEEQIYRRQRDRNGRSLFVNSPVVPLQK